MNTQLLRIIGRIGIVVNAVLFIGSLLGIFALGFNDSTESGWFAFLEVFITIWMAGYGLSLYSHAIKYGTYRLVLWALPSSLYFLALLGPKIRWSDPLDLGLRSVNDLAIGLCVLIVGVAFVKRVTKNPTSNTVETTSA